MDLLGGDAQARSSDLQATLAALCSTVQQLALSTQQSQQQMATLALGSQKALEAVSQSLTAQTQSQAFKAASIEHISGDQPGKLFLWFKKLEGLAASCNVNLDDPTVLARISGYFTGELGLWFATKTPALLRVPYLQFKQAILDHFGLYTSPEVAVMTLLSLTVRRATDYGRYLTEFNNILGLLHQDTTDQPSRLEKLYEISIFRKGLPQALTSVAAEYTGTEVEGLQTHIRNRLVRDSALAAAVKFTAGTLESPTALDLGLAVQPSAVEVNPIRADRQRAPAQWNRPRVRSEARDKSRSVSFRNAFRRAGARIRYARRPPYRNQPPRRQPRMNQRRLPSPPPPTRYQPQYQSTPDRCYRCGETGHWANRCPNAMEIGVVTAADRLMPRTQTQSETVRSHPIDQSLN